eukprot:4462125-Prymnesium_polylepis.1
MRTCRPTSCAGGTRWPPLADGASVWSESSECRLREPVSNGMRRLVCTLVMFITPSPADGSTGGPAGCAPTAAEVGRPAPRRGQRAQRSRQKHGRHIAASGCGAAGHSVVTRLAAQPWARGARAPVAVLTW